MVRAAKRGLKKEEDTYAEMENTPWLGAGTTCLVLTMYLPRRSETK